ncbi:MAG: HIT domain-containing protein [Candidatus Portnoybacteria bacterium]|nr:HIT domain-containing protein [Candidatus Portnoybacteria bacterium]
MPDIFCQIIKKQLPAFIVYETKTIIAFLDTEPYSKGHILIMPKKHVVELQDVDSRTLKEVILLASRLAKIVKEMFKFDGVVFLCNSGKKLQDIDHLHFHVYGLNKGQKGFYYQKFKSNKTKEQALQEITVLIRKELMNG